MRFTSLYLVLLLTLALWATGSWAEDIESPFLEFDENQALLWENADIDYEFSDIQYSDPFGEFWQPIEIDPDGGDNRPAGLRRSIIPMDSPDAAETRTDSIGVLVDCFQNENNPSEYGCGTDYIRVGYRYGWYHALFKADICRDADEIVSASLRINIKGNYLATTEYFRIYAISDSWYSPNWYGTPDYYPNVYSSTSVSSGTTGWVSFNALNAAKLYCEDGYTNWGFFLRHHDSSHSINYIHFDSEEANNDNPVTFYDVTYILRCDIGGQKYDHLETNPANPCLVCDVDQDLEHWSLNDGGACDDGVFCNGADTCQVGSCSVHAGDPCPDDGLWCNGAESCNESGGQCETTGAPCDSVCQDCNDTADTCVDNSDSCNDGLYCNGADTCAGGTCSIHAGNPCPDNGLFCDGEEYCDEVGNQCDVQNVPNCVNDNLWCNGEEYCDETLNACSAENVPDCSDDGLWCNGEEFCNENDNACDRENIPDCDADDGLWCNGIELCDEDADQCGHEFGDGNPRCNDGIFCNGEDPCNEETDQCGHGDQDPCTDDGLWCNGEESCDEVGDQCLHSGDPCDDGEECIEDNDECIDAPDDDTDDDTSDDDADDDTTSPDDDDTSDDDTSDDDTISDDDDDDETSEPEQSTGGSGDSDSTGSGCGC